MVELQCAVKQEAKIIQHRLKFLLESKGHAGGQATEVAAQRTGKLAPSTREHRYCQTPVQ